MEENNQNPNKVSETDNRKLMAVIAYFIFFLPLFTDKKDDPFVKFHVKQSIGLVIAMILISIVGTLIPFIGWFIIAPLGNVMVFVLWIIGLLNAFKGEQKLLPIIGKLAEDNLKF